MTDDARHVYRSRPPAALRPALAVARHFTDAAHRASQKPFDASLDLLPHTELSGRFGWSHYGLMLPSLPDPHRYLSLMVMAGMTGLRAFDFPEEATSDDPQDIIVASASSGADSAYTREVLSIRREGRFAPDRAEFGSLASITGTHPEFDIRIHAGDLDATLTMTCRPNPTWFVKSPVWQHLGHVGRYRGEVTHRGVTTEISGVGNLEYARSISPYVVLRRATHRQIPLEWFSYQVVDLPGERQILFTQLGVAGSIVETNVIRRSLDGTTDHKVYEGYHRILETDDTPAVDTYGNERLLPRVFEFGCDGVSVVGTYDCPQRFAIGRGHISGYEARVRIDGEEFITRGYSEHIDERPHRHRTVPRAVKTGTP
ncbi:DUF6670 family protein [Gordonia alkanivorans]|uniref:Uncharacterized protein n=1 Tax=Gordonia alkanivorans CGMCC 6845 TaxID=1423140 RepID=W9DDX6_9ACTN|nr:DUF6670 family protein [Gordonia alkanivorans]ETA06594.1 hypothetical protein V525_12420 [Gordonia alkanivorans CGMCC 6845]